MQPAKQSYVNKIKAEKIANEIKKLEKLITQEIKVTYKLKALSKKNSRSSENYENTASSEEQYHLEVKQKKLRNDRDTSIGDIGINCWKIKNLGQKSGLEESIDPQFTSEITKAVTYAIEQEAEDSIKKDSIEKERIKKFALKLAVGVVAFVMADIIVSTFSSNFFTEYLEETAGIGTITLVIGLVCAICIACGYKVSAPLKEEKTVDYKAVLNSIFVCVSQSKEGEKLELLYPEHDSINFGDKVHRIPLEPNVATELKEQYNIAELRDLQYKQDERKLGVDLGIK